MVRGGGSPYASWWSTCCATTTSAEQRRVHMVSYSTHSAQLHNLSYLSGEHNCTRFPTSGQGYFLRQRHGVHRLRLLITAPEPSQPLCLEQQNRNNLLQSTFHQVARSEIAPQSNNGSCPIICPRLWSASCSDGTTRRKVDFARDGVTTPTTKSQLGDYSPPADELLLLYPHSLKEGLPYT